MWAESWVNLGATVNPYPSSPTTNVTASMKKQEWSEKTMFEKGLIHQSSLSDLSSDLDQIYLNLTGFATEFLFELNLF